MTVPPPSNHPEKRRRFSKMRNPGSGSEPFRQATKAERKQDRSEVSIAVIPQLYVRFVHLASEQSCRFGESAEGGNRGSRPPPFVPLARGPPERQRREAVCPGCRRPGQTHFTEP